MTTFTKIQIAVAIPPIATDPATLEAGQPQRDLVNAVLGAIHDDISALEDGASTAATAIAAKADGAATAAALSAKLDTAGLSAAVAPLIAGKADTAAVNTALALKADSSAVTAGLAAKADTSALTAGLESKADATATTSALDAITTELGNKLGADQAITTTALPDAGAGTDVLIVQRGTAVHTQTREQLASSVLGQVPEVTATKPRLALTDELVAFDSESADAPITTTPAQIKSLVRHAWAIPGTYAHGGDSRCAQGYVDATLTPGTYAGQHTTRNTCSWLMGLLGHPLRQTQAAGVGGDTIAMFVARQLNTVGGSLYGAGSAPGWVAYRPEFLFLDLGINDVLNNSTITLATSLAGARAILDVAQTMGTTVIWPNEYPEGPAGTAMSVESETRRLAWNAALKALETEYPCLWVPDVSATMRNPTGGKLWPGLTSDTTGIHIHLNNAGAKMRAEAVAAYIAPLFALRKPLVLAHASTELISVNPACNQYQVNPNLATGATVADVLAVAVSFGAGATGTATLIADPEGYGQAVQIDVTYTGASSAYALVSFKASQASFAGGECFVAGSRVRLGLPGGSAGQLAAGVLPAHMVRCPESMLLVTDAVADGGIAHNRANFALNTNDAGITGGLEYTVVSPDYQLRPGAPQLVQNQLWLRGIGAGSGAVRWIVSRPTLRRVPRRSDVVSALG